MKKLCWLFLLASSAFAQNVSSIYPASGPTSGGTFVHILGTDLIGFPLACPALDCGDYVKFGDTAVTISVNTGTEIVVLTPPHTAGTVDVTLNVAGKAKLTIPAAFRYEQDDSTSYEHVLIPIVASNAPGAFGSVWQSETTFSNNSGTNVILLNDICFSPAGDLTCLQIFISPHATAIFNQPRFPGAPGIFLLVPRSRIDDIDMQLRVQDTSRQSQTWGTEIPIVRDTDLRSVVRLHNVPTDSRFRLTLRAYNYIGVLDPIRVRILDETTQAILVDDLPTVSPALASYVQINSRAA